MPATLIPTSPSSQLYKDAENRFYADWAAPITRTRPQPAVVNVFYVNHERQQVWYNYDAYRKRVGNEQYMYHGTTRACNIGDDNTQVTACQLFNCGVCSILRTTLDPSMGLSRGMFGKGSYVAPNSSKSYNPRYLRNANPAQSPNLVLLRCSVAVGKTFMAFQPMRGVTEPPPGHDSITGVTRANGGVVDYPETVVFTKDAILPVEIIVLRSPTAPAVDLYARFTKKLTNVSTADWSKYSEAIDSKYGDILWTDGDASHTFSLAPNIHAYKAVKRNPATSPTGTVVAEGYASSNPFYFVLG